MAKSKKPKKEEKPAMEAAPAGGDFLSDVQELRRRARKHIENGAVTEGYRADREKGDRRAQRGAGDRDRVRAPLQAALLHGERHPRQGGRRRSSSQHANEEQGHADQIAERITQLGGEPDFSTGGPRDAQPLRVHRGQDARRHDPGGSRRRAHRDRVLRRDRRATWATATSTTRRSWRRSSPRKRSTPTT